MQTIDLSHLTHLRKMIKKVYSLDKVNQLKKKIMQRIFLPPLLFSIRY
jgi:uncharacterized protein YqhQ